MNEERLREGFEHLQAAALELIEAARAFLDVAEDAVKDPGELLALATALASRVQATGPRPHPGAESPDQPRVERIRVV